jgi:hypothetical protein
MSTNDCSHANGHARENGNVSGQPGFLSYNYGRPVVGLLTNRNRSYNAMSRTLHVAEAGN